jgi:hypothetical protein
MVSVRHEVVTAIRVVSSFRKLMSAKLYSLIKYFRLNDNPGRGYGQSNQPPRGQESLRKRQFNLEKTR